MRWTTPEKPINSPKQGYTIPVENLSGFDRNFENVAETIQHFGGEEKLLGWISNQYQVQQTVSARRVLQDADAGKTGDALGVLIAEAVSAGKDWAPGDREKGKGSQKDRAKQMDSLKAIATSGRDEDRQKLAAAIASGDIEALTALLGQG